MQSIKIRALVLKTADYGEYDKMLTLLGEGVGKISVSVKGAKSIHGGKPAVTEAFCYGEYVLNEKGDIYSFSQASPLECFLGLSDDIDRLTCASEILKFADTICQKNEQADELLRLILNSLFALSNLKKSAPLVKTAFYLRCVSLLGIEPELFFCSACGEQEDLTHFSNEYGGVMCGSCSAEAGGTSVISNDCLMLMRYVVSCDLKKLFAFSAPQNVLDSTYKVVKSFVLHHLDLNI